MKIRIYYHDTDCGGVVYYANYPKYLEEARTEYLERRGLSVKEFLDAGFMFVVYRQEIDYKYPAFYGDGLEVVTKIISVSEVKIEFEYLITNQAGRITTKAKTVLVTVGKNLEPRPLPAEIKKKLLKG